MATKHHDSELVADVESVGTVRKCRRGTGYLHTRRRWHRTPALRRAHNPRGREFGGRLARRWA